MSGDFQFDDALQEGSIPMGVSLSVDSSDVDIVEQAITEVKDERDISRFVDFCNGRPFVVFDKADIAHFIDLVGYHSRLGYDTYTLSFKIDTSKVSAESKVGLVYNNGNVLAMSDVPVVASEGDVVKSCIVSIDTMLKIFSASRGYVFLYEDDGNLYGYVFGGKVYLETFRVEKDICAREYLADQLSVKAVGLSRVDSGFISMLKVLYEIVKGGSRIEEKAIYFEPDSTYIYSGIAVGKFPGFGISLTLQDLDISTVSKFFFDIKGDLVIEDHGIFVKYSYGSRSVYLARRGLVLSDDMKYVDTKVEDGVLVDVRQVQTIVGFLINMANNNGMLNIQPSPGGISLVCYQKALDYNSAFRVSGSVVGNSISEVRVPLGVLKTFIRIFGGSVSLTTVGNRIYLRGSEGKVAIFGNL